MTMVLNESLRLYPNVPFMIRISNKEIKLNDFLLPKGATLNIPILAVHHNEKLWGSYANVFKPERFAKGASRAGIHPNAFFPFSLGPRSCVGQNFAMLEAKIVLAMILQRWSFRLFPAYKHAPITVVTLQPGNGMPNIFKNI